MSKSILTLRELNDNILPGSIIGYYTGEVQNTIMRNGVLIFQRVYSPEEAEKDFAHLDSSSKFTCPRSHGVMVARHVLPKVGCGPSAQISTALEKRRISFFWDEKFIVTSQKATMNVFQEIYDTVRERGLAHALDSVPHSGVVGYISGFIDSHTGTLTRGAIVAGTMKHFKGKANPTQVNLVLDGVLKEKGISL